MHFQLSQSLNIPVPKLDLLIEPFALVFERCQRIGAIREENVDLRAV